MVGERERKESKEFVWRWGRRDRETDRRERERNEIRRTDGNKQSNKIKRIKEKIGRESERKDIRNMFYYLKVLLGICYTVTTET